MVGLQRLLSNGPTLAVAVADAAFALHVQAVPRAFRPGKRCTWQLLLAGGAVLDGCQCLGWQGYRSAARPLLPPAGRAALPAPGLQPSWVKRVQAVLRRWQQLVALSALLLLHRIPLCGGCAPLPVVVAHAGAAPCLSFCKEDCRDLLAALGTLLASSVCEGRIHLCRSPARVEW